MLQKHRTYFVCPEFSLDRGVPKERFHCKHKHWSSGLLVYITNLS